MKCRLIAPALVYLFLVGASVAAKVDVMGISMGMPMADFKQLIKAKGLNCEPDPKSSKYFECRTSEFENVVIRFAEALPNTPVCEIRLTFLTGGITDKDVIASISQQYGARPTGAWGGDAEWTLSDGSLLAMESGGAGDGIRRAHILRLHSKVLQEANEKAIQDQTAARSPMPKF